MKTLTQGCTVPKTVCKFLYGLSLHSQLKSNANGFHAKQIFNECISGDTFKKYEVQHLAEEIITPKQNKKISKKINVLDYESKSKKIVDVKAFRAYFEKDDIFRMCPGRKDFIVRGKVKNQKRNCWKI